MNEEDRQSADEAWAAYSGGPPLRANKLRAAVEATVAEHVAQLESLVEEYRTTTITRHKSLVIRVEKLEAWRGNAQDGARGALAALRETSPKPVGWLRLPTVAGEALSPKYVHGPERPDVAPGSPSYSCRLVPLYGRTPAPPESDPQDPSGPESTRGEGWRRALNPSVEEPCSKGEECRATECRQLSDDRSKWCAGCRLAAEIERLDARIRGLAGEDAWVDPPDIQVAIGQDVYRAVWDPGDPSVGVFPGYALGEDEEGRLYRDLHEVWGEEGLRESDRAENGVEGPVPGRPPIDSEDRGER